MDIIKRRICLEDFISRTNTKWGYENGSWGKIAYDIAIPEHCPLFNINNKLPMIDNIDIKMGSDIHLKNQLQFNALMEWYRWVIKFINDIIFYKKCKRKKNNEYTYIWSEVEYDFLNDDPVNLYSRLEIVNPNDENIENGTIIGVNENAEKFNEIFRSRIVEDGFLLRYEKILIEIAEEVIKGDNKRGIEIVTPYIELPININESIDSLGSYENYIDKWDYKVKYPKGSTVLRYDEDVKEWNCYKLISGNDIEVVELTGLLYDFFENELKKGVYNTITFNNLNDYKNILIGNDLTDNGKPVLVVSDTKIYYPSIVHSSVYDEERGEYMFNTSDNIYWKKIEIDDTLEENIKTVTESRLTSLIRNKKSVNEEGEVLPFVINNKGEKDTDLRYCMGYTNHSITNNDEIYFDSLDKVEIYDTNIIEDSGENEQKPYTTIELENGKVKITDKDNNVKYQVEDGTNFFTISSNLFPEKGDVRFFYKIGGVFSNNGDDVPNIISNGVCYNEYYSFEKKSGLYNVKIPDSILEKYNVKHELVLEDYNLDFNDDVDIIANWAEKERKEKNIGNVYLFMDVTHGLLTTQMIEYSYYNESGETVNCSVENVEAEFVGNYKLINNLYYMEFKIISGDYSSNTKKLRRFYVINKKWSGSEINNDGTINVEIVLNTHKLISNKPCKLTIKDKVGTYVKLLSKYYYIDINYEDKKTTFVNEYLDYKEEKTILSNTEYGGIAVSDDNFIISEVYKNPLDIGVEDKEINVDINIERGTSAFFELYHILSEVNTMQDLENYRNNLFKI